MLQGAVQSTVRSHVTATVAAAIHSVTNIGGGTTLT
jgi:hypothetical protein